ncbi:MAG: AIM24 family protein [bacterium]
MQHEIMYRPSYSLLKIKLSKDEVITAEAGAIVSMSKSIEIETKMKGKNYEDII